MDEDVKIYEIYSVDGQGKPRSFEAAYDTVVEVLAHFEEKGTPRVVKIDGKFFSMQRFLETYASAG
jgi:hypothetical protein